MRRQFMRDRQEIEVDARQSLTEFIVNFPGDPRPLHLADALKFAGQRVELAQPRATNRAASERGGTHGGHRAVVLPNNRRAAARCRSPV